MPFKKALAICDIKKVSYIRKGKCRPATPTAAPSRSGDPLPLGSEMGWTGELW